MKTMHRWHCTPFGRAVLFLGGIRFAVPVLLLVAGALAWGTWVESTQSAAAAGRLIYGAWWFIGLMLLVCLSLALSVATRYPWQRKHVGFIVVHASLTLLIASAFLSFFTRIEGQVVLAEGENSGWLQLNTRQIEVLVHDSDQFEPVDSILVEGTKSFEIAGVSVRIDERWGNTRQEFDVADDGANPLHAVRLRPGAGEPVWIGQSDLSAAPQELDGVYVRVLPEEQAWEPDESSVEHLLVTSEEDRLSIPAVGATIDGTEWTVTKIENFRRVIVSSDGLTERSTGDLNPAFVLHLAHPDGSIERHIVFERFPENVHKQTISGESHSPFALRSFGKTLPEPMITFERIDSESVVIIVSEGETERFVRPAEGSWVIESGIVGSFEVLDEYTHARGFDRLVEAPEAENNQPAVVISYTQGDHEHSAVLLWMQRVPLQFGDEIRMLRYGSVLHELPFNIELADFRKVDYPGTTSAMAYESDVRFSPADGSPSDSTISMNRPLKHAGWKVYQSGFVGDTISVFQVMRDPGLIPTYFACTSLCIGIVITFYCGALSRGHPGMPLPFQSKPRTEGVPHEAVAHRSIPCASVLQNGDGGDIRNNSDSGGAADPAPRPGHAVVHVCETGRGPTHRPHEMV